MIELGQKGRILSLLWSPVGLKDSDDVTLY